MLENFYNELFNETLAKFQNKEFDYDNLIDSTNDKRYGITLIIRSSQEIKNNISGIQEKIKRMTGNQYFYPAKDLHITLGLNNSNYQYNKVYVIK